MRAGGTCSFVLPEEVRAYLIGRPFVVYSDHRTLSQVFKKKDVHGRLARWLDLFAEYEFTIEHKEGAQNGVADACSRTVVRDDQEKHSQVVLEGKFEDYLQQIQLNLGPLQLSDGLDSVQKRNIRRRAISFLAIDGRLFCRTEKGLCVVVPAGDPFEDSEDVP